MIIVTSPNGVFKVNEKNSEVEKILNGNFFGIDICANKLYLAKRIGRNCGTYVCECDISDNFKINNEYIFVVEDVHQIFVNKYGIILTDTACNSVVSKHFISDNSPTRQYIDNNQLIEDPYHIEDVNHVNALCMDEEGTFYIGLNNKGIYESQIIKDFVDESLDELITLKGVYHSHDLEPYKNDILISASHQGFIYSLNNKEPLFYTDKDSWVRGLCVSDEGVWVGYSAVSPRTSRQDPTLKNSINLFSHNDFKHIKQIEIKGAGQICDMVYIDDDNS